MAATAERPNVLSATAPEGLLDSFQEANRLLELIQQGLNDYLEKKRLSFARLFFLSNDELLQILSETKDPLRVQPHLKKCFEGIAKLQFAKNLDILSMISSEKERIPFPYDEVDEKVINPNDARGCVEIWLDVPSDATSLPNPRPSAMMEAVVPMVMAASGLED